MAKVLFLIALLNAFFLISSGQFLNAVEKDAPKSTFVERSLDAGLDVRGDYDDFILIVSNEPSSNSLDYDLSLLTYFVLERQTRVDREVEFPFFIRTVNSYVKVGTKYVVAVSNEEKALDSFYRNLSPKYEVVVVSESTVLKPFKIEEHPDLVKIYAKYSGKLALDPVISQLISYVTPTDLKAFVTYLSGESPASPLLTRQAQSPGAVVAQDWLGQKFAEYGFSVSTQSFRAGYSYNVIGQLTGIIDPLKLVLVTAHYDDRSTQASSTTQRAPGANDNGSGTGALLQIAKLISENSLKFAYTVQIVAFSGEEQGLYGSIAYAQALRTQNADVVAVLNADMIAYRQPGEVPQCAFAARSSTLTLNTLLTNITKTYVPALVVGTSTGCCTDHSSFYNQGFPATSFFERNGPIADPQYHQSGDLVNRQGYDIELQYPEITRAVFASLLTIAQYSK